MDTQSKIDQYDLVEIIRVPEEYKGIIDMGDTGVVVEKYDEENIEIDCLRPGGPSKWIEPLHIRYLRLKSKDPYNPWIRKSLEGRSMMRSSVMWGALIGAGAGALTIGGLGAIARSINGLFISLMIGLALGAMTGALTAALTVKTAGRTGGVGVGYFTGILFGGALGFVLGALIPASLRLRAHTEGLPVLDALAMGRFETAVLASFALSVLAAIVGGCRRFHEERVLDGSPRLQLLEAQILSRAISVSR